MIPKSSIPIAEFLDFEKPSNSEEPKPWPQTIPFDRYEDRQPNRHERRAAAAMKRHAARRGYRG
jgi:hypothetical protein